MEINIGDFIYHSHYGVGRIEENEMPMGKTSPASEELEFKVKFQNGESKTFTQNLLERSARKISPLGFRAFSYLNETGAKELVATDPVEVISMTLQDFPGLVAKNEDLKDYLAPYISDWTEWWETTQPKLKESPFIDTSRTKFREYGLRKDAMSSAEEIYRSFLRIRPFEDRSIVYEQARRTLAEYLNGSSLADEHFQDVLIYVKQFIEVESNPPDLRLDAIFRLQEGKLLTDEQFAEYISLIIKSGVRLYQLDLFSLNRMVEYLIASPLSPEDEDLLASGICAGETMIKALCDWALARGDSDFISRLLVTALSENIPPQLDNENLSLLVMRFTQIEKLLGSVEAGKDAWPTIVAHFQNLVMEFSKLNVVVIAPIIPPLMSFSGALYHRIHNHHPDLARQILDCLLTPTNPKQFVLGLLDATAKSDRLSEFGFLLEEQLWAEGEDRNYDFIRELIHSKGTSVEQVKSLVGLADQYDSFILKGHVGDLICEIIKKETTADPLDFLPSLNKLHEWGPTWRWSQTIEGLRETIYLNALEHPFSNFGDDALKSAIDHFLASRTQELDKVIAQNEKEIQQANHRINELEALLKEREQVISELRSGYGGDTTEARFSERVRIIKELASSAAEFERMGMKSTEKSREVQAILLRIYNILTSFNVLPMEEIGSSVQFTPQKHHAVDASVVNPGDTVMIVERGYLIRDNKDKLRLLKPALVKR